MQHLLEKNVILLQTVQNLCQSRKAFLWRCTHCTCIYFWQWIVSWQICVASLPESVTWVYSRFHRWCNNAWEDGRIASANCATNSCNMFFKKYSIKLRLLSRTWPNISKLERAVLIFASFFPRFFPSVGYCKETGMNHRQSCQSAFGSAVKHP